MIDVSNLKSPGWQRVVLELAGGAPPADDKAFFDRVMKILAQVSAARRAALFLPTRTEGDEIEPREVSTWPDGPIGDVDAGEAPGSTPGPSEFAAEVKNAARQAFGSGGARAFAIDKGAGPYYDAAGPQGYILAVPLAVAAAPAPGSTSSTMVQIPAVVTMVIEPRSKEAVRSTLAMAEVIAGYVHTHFAKQQLRRTQTASYALDLATRLIAAINTPPNFKGALLQLANDLSRQLPADRVAIGWVRHDTVRVEAMSDTEHFDRRMAMVRKLQAAMDECLDQEQPVLFPQPSGEGPAGDVLLSQAIVHSHRELAAADPQLKVCSLPLRIDDEIIGVVTVEVGGDGKLDVGVIELLQAALDLLAPVLKIRRSDDRHLPARAWVSTVRAAGWLVGPRHTVWKMVGVLLLAAALFVSLYQKTYRVTAEAVLQPRERRIVSAPFDGTIEQIRDALEPGLTVHEGDVLVRLDTRELELSRADVRGRMAQAEAQEAAALKEKDTASAAKAHAQWEQARAQLEYIDYRIAKSTITAPITGRVITGDLKNRVNSTIKLGDPLLEIARMDDIEVIAQVKDSDMWLVRDAFDRNTGRTGQIVAKSQPSRPFDLTMDRIVPLSQAKDGKNTFEVRMTLHDPPDWFSPGMEGIAKIDTQLHSLLWIGTRKVLDALRLWWW
ncbi:MAG: efflux RND transporter periplasmic adaptor subunit [Phycisphaerales bacterium]